MADLPTPATRSPTSWVLSLAGVLLCGVLGTFACGGASAQSRDEADSHLERARNANLSRAGRRLETADLDGDGQPDQWSFYEIGSGQLVRAERDIDFDGRIDLYEYYDRDGRVVEDEMHLDFDESIDAVRFYRNDALIRRQLAVGFDGEFSMVKYYDQSGNVLRVERDSNGDGQMDTWEYFDDNQLIRVGRDEDGDGTPEIVEAAP